MKEDEMMPNYWRLLSKEGVYIAVHKKATTAEIREGAELLAQYLATVIKSKL